MRGRTGKKCWNWKGGKINFHGRIYIFKPGHPNAVLNGNYVARYRYKMSQRLGRPLRPDEIVHHKNHIKTDDRICNLELTTKSEHAKHHSNNMSRSTILKHKRNFARRIKDNRGRLVATN